LKNPNIAAAVAEATDKLLKEVHITKGDVLLKLYGWPAWTRSTRSTSTGGSVSSKTLPLEVRQCIKSIKVRRVNLDPAAAPDH